MFYVNDDDIEGLFRTAAENYDINAEQAADFNGVLKALHEEEGSEAQKPEKKKRRFLVFWWFIVLPFIGLLLWNITLFRDNNNSTLKAPAGTDNKINNQPQQEKIAQEQAASTLKDNSAALSKSIAPLPAVTTKSWENSNTIANAAIISAEKSFEKSNSNANHDFDALLKIQDEQILPKTTGNQNLPLQNDLQKGQPLPQPTTDKSASQALLNENKQTEAAASNAEVKNSNTDVGKELADAQHPSKVSAAIKPVKTKNASKPGRLKTNYFYAGVAASADLTFIKFQKMTHPGFNAGIITGYRFNKKWQLETGIIIDKKNYYTEGQYFDKSKVPYLNWVDLKSVSGYCSMYEIPLNARFNFNEKNNHLWFASAGISSYLMKKEYYNYAYIYNGSYRNRDYTYKTEKDWAAVMNISAGYEIKAGTKNYLRFEPYYKIPLKGVGTGSLPLSSAGVNIAFTRRIP